MPSISSKKWHMTFQAHIFLKNMKDQASLNKTIKYKRLNINVFELCFILLSTFQTQSEKNVGTISIIQHLSYFNYKNCTL